MRSVFSAASFFCLSPMCAEAELLDGGSMRSSENTCLVSGHTKEMLPGLLLMSGLLFGSGASHKGGMLCPFPWNAAELSAFKGYQEVGLIQSQTCSTALLGQNPHQKAFGIIWTKTRKGSGCATCSTPSSRDDNRVTAPLCLSCISQMFPKKFSLQSF